MPTTYRPYWDAAIQITRGPRATRPSEAQSGTPIDRELGERLARLLNLAAISSRPSISPPIMPQVISLREYFKKLAKWWRRDTDHLSSFAQAQRHEDYQEAVALGDRAIPFMLEDLRDNNGSWYVALHDITGVEPPIPSGYDADFWGEKEAWLQWGRAQGYPV